MQLKSSQHGSKWVKYYCAAMVYSLMISSDQSYGNQYLLNLLLTNDFEFYENLGAYILGNHSHTMKASLEHKPYTTQLHEAMSGEHRDDFLATIGKYIKYLEQQNNWKVVKKTSIPCGANLLPSIWAFNIKRYPDGSLWKHKAIFFVRGDR